MNIEDHDDRSSDASNQSPNYVDGDGSRDESEEIRRRTKRSRASEAKTVETSLIGKRTSIYGLELFSLLVVIRTSMMIFRIWCS